MKSIAAVVLSILLFSPSLARAETRALLIGIDRYVYKRPILRGAVNDATAIGAALRGRGVRDVTLLTDGAATRAAAEARWAELMSRSMSGDVVILSFAGHGIRVPETGPTRKTPDGYDKGFVLAPYTEKPDIQADQEELLRDEHLYDWFSDASRRGLRVIFIADACHSGNGYRGGSDQAVTRSTRYETSSGPTTLPPPDPTRPGRPAPAGLNVLSATDPDHSVTEFQIDGAWHGALSATVAVALAGGADGIGAGAVTIGSLRSYTEIVVRVQTGNSQNTQFEVHDPDVVLVQGSGKSDTAPQTTAALPVVTLAASNGSIAGLDGVRPVDRVQAQLVWDAQASVLRNGSGDLVATAIGPGALQGAVDGRRLVGWLDDVMQARGVPLDTSLRSVDASGRAAAANDRLYRLGETVRFEADRTTLRFLTVFDITGSGIVQFLYPLKDRGIEDPLEWTAPGSPAFTAPVSAPFGADTVVFIETDKPLTDLHAVLRAADKRASAAALYAALGSALHGVSAKIGIQSAYTCARVGDDGRCDQR